MDIRLFIKFTTDYKSQSGYKNVNFRCRIEFDRS